ncbi:hypothetical protein VST7929_01796 [Vibrio stylophorae]|uniref:Uncharacterized protein n=1 Tax=Vibrio stylophorae TaxID=659351 RepID=A0ABM8ZUD2_9VIBR|nr:hypothetical protein [Vibrio stylophorae]CAH0533919.1 hypothetical protein VST7929_01796 [Vibrio stylophorae]
MRKPWLMMLLALFIFVGYGRNIAPAQPPVMVPKILSLAEIYDAGGVEKAWQNQANWYWASQP